MIELKQKTYDKVKYVFEKYNNGIRFNDMKVNLSHDEMNYIISNISRKKLSKILIEYIDLLEFKIGDSFENHFQIKEQEKHYYKTKGGYYLGKVRETPIISFFTSKMFADRLSAEELKDFDFDFDKLQVCDEEF